ncbi:MAG: hydrogenase maturation protease [Candidatus Tantalella remota]|nr:hydrogenase maturation protease [Candidatus Tantalella remota]
MTTLIVGVGSILRCDDGIGPRVIDELEKEDLPGDVSLHSGDISGLDLLKHFPEKGRVLIIDAADMGEDPGTVRVFGFSDIGKADFNDQFSTHGIGLLETLTLAEKIGTECEITIIGVQPYDTSYDLEMTEFMTQKVPQVIAAVKRLM